jgi:hypothetical protein
MMVVFSPIRMILGGASSDLSIETIKFN